MHCDTWIMRMSLPLWLVEGAAGLSPLAPRARRLIAHCRDWPATEQPEDCKPPSPRSACALVRAVQGRTSKLSVGVAGTTRSELARLCARGFVIGVLLIVGTRCVKAGEPPATASGDGPPLVAVFEGDDGGWHFAAKDGPPVFLQNFVYSLEKKEAHAVEGGLAITKGGVPIRMSVTFGSNFSGGIATIFGNTRLDLSGAGGRLFLGHLYAEDGGRLARIRVDGPRRPDGTSRLAISEKYVVSADDYSPASVSWWPRFMGTACAAGPFVTVKWTTESEGLSGSLVAIRNGRTIANSELRQGTDVVVALSGVSSSDDVVDWHLEGEGKDSKRSGMVAFPVLGAASGIVTYEVIVK